MTAFILIITILFLIVFILFFNFAFAASERIFCLIFNRPFFVHFYTSLDSLPDQQAKILYCQVPFYKSLNQKHRKYFEHRVSKFIDNYEYIGKENLEITDEIKVLIASTSIMLSFGMRNYLYSIVDKIIVYPTQYYSTINEVFHQGEFNPRMRAVVFSWEHFKLGNEHNSNNLNLGIHEFTHVLNYQSLKSDDTSAVIFARNYKKIQENLKNKQTLNALIAANYFREYAYTNNFEFIAVVLEHFFETPKEFKRLFPDLFENVRVMINYDEKRFR